MDLQEIAKSHGYNTIDEFIYANLHLLPEDKQRFYKRILDIINGRK